MSINTNINKEAISSCEYLVKKQESFNRKSLKDINSSGKAPHKI